jgi:predicted Rossmann fold nucleotide-binding protein DprA/Smf involved in DNA uptake
MLDWLRLARTPEVGPATFAQLIARFGSASSALEELPRLARRGGGKIFVPATEEDTAREWERWKKRADAWSSPAIRIFRKAWRRWRLRRR